MFPLSLFSRLCNNFFPGLTPKLTATVNLLLTVNFLTVLLFLVTLFFDASNRIPLYAAITLFVCSIFMALGFRKAILEDLEKHTSEIESLFSHVEDGRVDLASQHHAATSERTRQIGKKHDRFLVAIRDLVARMRRIGIDIAVDAAIVTASTHDTTTKTTKQQEITGIVSTASQEACNAIAEVSQSAQYVSDKTAENLKVAQGSHQDLVEVTEKTEKINL